MTWQREHRLWIETGLRLSPSLDQRFWMFYLTFLNLVIPHQRIRITMPASHVVFELVYLST